MSQYAHILEPFLGADAAGFAPERKRELLMLALTELHHHHLEGCSEYRAICASLFERPLDSLAELPFLPVRLMKELELKSVGDEQIVRVLHSSGTTGQERSKVFLDRETAATQRRALAQVFSAYLGDERLPMLIVDAESTIRQKNMTARAAGILGMRNFGRKHVYALDDDQAVNVERVAAFADQHRGKPVLIFGFTFMVWQALVEGLAAMPLDLKGAILIHSGGWKKLQALAVDDARFKEALRAAHGIERVHDFYGMVEQVGSVFVQCESGHLHASSFSEVLVRRPGSWQLCEDGEVGVLQLLSVIPWSYPGHSLLTEDLGRVTGRDTCGCGRTGTTFEVVGRVPRAELRGCSDTAEGIGAP